VAEKKTCQFMVDPSGEIIVTDGCEVVYEGTDSAQAAVIYEDLLERERVSS